MIEKNNFIYVISWKDSDKLNNCSPDTSPRPNSSSVIWSTTGSTDLLFHSRFWSFRLEHTLTSFAWRSQLSLFLDLLWITHDAPVSFCSWIWASTRKDSHRNILQFFYFVPITLPTCVSIMEAEATTSGSWKLGAALPRYHPARGDELLLAKLCQRKCVGIANI